MNGSPAPGGPVPAGPPGAVTGLVYAVNAAWNALTYVYDPELYLDVVSLGLIYDVCDENGVIVVEMTLPPGCPASDTLPEMARAAVTEAVGDATAPVEVRVVRDPPWSPAMIDDAAAAALAFRIR
jgi:metal-sulfur cluster biosynthetic enzyme